VPAGHLGLIIMRERADAVGAKLDISSSPGGGTDVRLSVAGV
jgi:nitrate/nitrite-specific signal transduction histidine kinase